MESQNPPRYTHVLSDNQLDYYINLMQERRAQLDAALEVLIRERVRRALEPRLFDPVDPED